MFVGLQQLSIGEVISSLRDLSIFGVVITFVWKVRGVYETVQSFFTRVMKHMDVMETFAQVTVNNHLRHMERDLKSLAGRMNYAEDVGADVEVASTAESEAVTEA